MTNRDDLNIDSFLNSKQSLSNGTSKNLTQPNFDSQMDWSIINTPHIFNGAVTDAKLGNFTFNKGTGGTLTLGGTNNGNGQLIVRSSSGGTICTIDNNGITVSSGSITIKNSGGTTVLDPTGLNSNNNFEMGVVQAGGTTFLTTGTTFTNLPFGTKTTSNFTRSRTAIISLYAVAFFSGAGTGDFTTTGYLGFSIDGTTSDDFQVSKQGERRTTGGTGGGQYNDGVGRAVMSLTTVVSMGAGSHQISVMAKTDQTSGVGTFSLFPPRLNYTVLGN